MTPRQIKRGGRKAPPHACARNLDRVLMFVDPTGNYRTLTSSQAKTHIHNAGSVRHAARWLGIPKSTLHDLALDKNKIRDRRGTR